MPDPSDSPDPTSEGWPDAIGTISTTKAFQVVHDYRKQQNLPPNEVPKSMPSTSFTTPPPTLNTLLISPISTHSVLFTYNQPSISNAFTLSSYNDLAAALRWARLEPSITVIVVTGAGKHYCAGKVLTPPSESGPTIEEEIVAGGNLSAELLGYPKVLIAAVNGAAIGWGCTQLFNFDLVYAWENEKESKEWPGAFFQTPFTKLGFVPEGASSWSFPRVMGKQRANALLLASERMGAREMYEAGLVTKVVRSGSREGFLDEVKEVARRVGGYNGESLRLTKAQLNKPSVLAEQKEAGMREGVDLKVMLGGEEARRMMEGFKGREREKL